ncbi:hypothetical protein BDZ89DRAFT_1119656 [Hymenopellis radicata]|nr:hypothetical protein BDZ89DRAFT_1119656 [Hymenopellis radicata]
MASGCHTGKERLHPNGGDAYRRGDCCSGRYDYRSTRPPSLVRSGTGKTLSLPIRRLPAELHLIIFQYAFDNFEPSGSLAVSLVITSVCYRWRQLALSTPRLWTTIFASVDGHSHQLSNDALVNLHLERAGDLPLAASKHWFPQFAKLYNNFARWEAAELVLTQVEMRRLDKFVNGASLPLLRALKLVLTNDQLAQPYKTFLKAPKLDRVHARADTIRLPWSQIAHFTACRRTSQDISPWLRVREGRENHLTLHTLGEQFHPVHHARLTIPLALTSLDLDLRLGLLYYGGRHSPLRHFTVPFLKALTSILDASPGLRRLQIIDSPAFTSVTGLLGPELLQRLASAAFLPLLTSIELVWCQNMLDNALIDMLNCRMATGQAALRQVKVGLRDGREVSDVVAQFMNSLRQRGIQATTCGGAIKHRRSEETQAAILQEVVVNYVTDIDAEVGAAFSDLLSDGLKGGLTIRHDVMLEDVPGRILIDMLSIYDSGR